MIDKGSVDMKKTLIIGSSVCDVIIRLHRIPSQTEDENIISQEFSMGGCAYNVASVLERYQVPYDLFSPIGTGIYGDFVRNHFIENDIPILIETNQRNGCCYCLVDDTGERTFICEHGAEYFYQEKWFNQLDTSLYEQVYICGLEIEESTGDFIIDFLEKNPHFQIYFAPGPRIHYISEEKLKRIFALHPILHMNESEILTYTKQDNLSNAAELLFQLTNRPVIVTLGAKGSYFYCKDESLYNSGFECEVVDTIGAGDSHIGAILASRACSLPWQDCLNNANSTAAEVVSQKGATLKKCT